MTQKSGPQEFARRLAEIVRTCNDKSLVKENHIVFIDKNYPRD